MVGFYNIDEAVLENIETVFKACVTLPDNIGYNLKKKMFDNWREAIGTCNLIRLRVRGYQLVNNTP